MVYVYRERLYAHPVYYCEGLLDMLCGQKLAEWNYPVRRLEQVDLHLHSLICYGGLF